MALLVAALVPVENAFARPPLIVLVRHADREEGKACEDSANPNGPSLSLAGKTRALALEAALADAGIASILTTQYCRTQETALPLAKRRGITLEKIELTDLEEKHVAAVRASVLGKSAPVLVVGHSHTVPLIIAALGGPTMFELCPRSYGHIFFVTITPGGVAVEHKHYGEPDPPPGKDCL
jgi:broad specificity phosphatase PhoE